LDLRKAFDSLDHNVLLRELNSIGFTESSLSLMESYLRDRQQYVYINDTSSDTTRISVGVPQGSILGPLLLPLIGKIVLFADDCSIFYTDNDISSLRNKIEHDLIILIEFFRLNKIEINFNKTKLINFRSHRVATNDKLIIKLANIQLEEVESVNFLGGIIDNSLKWNFQTDQIVTRLSAQNAMLFKFKYKLPQSIKLNIFFALGHSILSYCAVFWAGRKNIKKVQTCQNKILKNFLNLPILYSTFDLYFNPFRPELILAVQKNI
jgi:hypothetical protein